MLVIMRRCTVAVLSAVLISSPLHAQAGLRRFRPIDRPAAVGSDSGTVFLQRVRVDTTLYAHFSSGTTPNHPVRNGAIVGAVVGALAGAIGGTFVPLGCQDTSSGCYSSRELAGVVGLYATEGLVAGAFLGALLGKGWAIVRSR
jgi:hypothetical protein